MADNYYEATGILVLDRVTPVITALFAEFKLDGNSPGNGQAYIAKADGSSDPQWEDVLDGLKQLAESLQLQAGELEDSIEGYLRALAKHFQAEHREDFEHLIEHHAFEDDADLEALFLIADCFDDGHGLRAIMIEAAWTCSKLRLFEFGGESLFISREVVLLDSSSNALELGRDLRDALASGSVDDAADRLATELERILSGVRDTATRNVLRQKLARKLLADEPSGDMAVDRP